MADAHTSLAVIGGGPGGYAAAFLAADLGLDVTLIDPEANPGGVCLYRGCIPSKALLHVAKTIYEAREAEDRGVRFSAPAIDLAKLRGWKEGVVNSLTGGLGRLVAQRKVTYIRGIAAFIDPKTLTVAERDGTTRSLTLDHAIIATGSRAVLPPGFPADSDRVWTSRHALALNRIPRRLLVVGGGYIGLELGSVYAALGAEVTVVEMMPTLIPGVDGDLVRFLKKNLETRFKDIRLSTKVAVVKAQKKSVKVTLESADGDASSLTFDDVLVAVGRRPYTDGLGLERTAIVPDARGFISIDNQRRTAEGHIFAIGDVAGDPMLAHKASHEARVAVEVITGKNIIYEPSAIPAVVFTDPEIAWAGLTETEAKIQGIDYRRVQFPWAASGKAMAMGRGDGLTKVLVQPETERILGVGLVGPGAGEMIAEAVVAIEMAATVTDLSLSVHPHPTLTETLKEAAESFHGTATHYFRPKRH